MVISILMSNVSAELFSVELMELQLLLSSISDRHVTVFKQACRHKDPLITNTGQVFAPHTADL